MSQQMINNFRHPSYGEFVKMKVALPRRVEDDKQQQLRAPTTAFSEFL
eukprot:CAMPEP_0173131634 /NCGR_PEP_ID=MMETSP1102-20130122/60751_1 /TAXON_ID=49646 /ORGANISM="Geminigera sp., Strain Caron Lab Isolate" /LENGTH=47 /DNA_ID= /DNA_START= /DNA_END= /DNA_ORIENTATION=